MSSWIRGLEADQAGDYVLAASLYEAVLRSAPDSLDVRLMLGQLYWDAVAMGHQQHLPDAFVATAHQRWPVLFDDAVERFPLSTAARFWSCFGLTPFATDEDITASMCRTWLEQDPTVLIPAMFLWSVERSAKHEARALVHECRFRRTSGARYVISLIDDPELWAEP